MVEGTHGSGFITEVPGGGADENPNQQVATRDNDDLLDDEQFS